MSGYQMRQMMEHSTANFWSESFGQIYPALKGMLADGLIELVDGSADAKGASSARERKVYRITDAGLHRLRDWLQVPARPQVNRDELLLKVFFGDRAGPGVIAEQVHRSRNRFEADLARYQATQERIETLYPHHPAMPYWRMTVRYGIAEARMVMAWCDETLEELQSAERSASRK